MEGVEIIPEPRFMLTGSEVDPNFLKRELHKQTRRPPDGDPIISAMFTALLDEIEQQSPVGVVADQYNKLYWATHERQSDPEASDNTRPDTISWRRASEAAGNMRSAIGAYLLGHTEIGYPFDGAEDPVRWRPVFEELGSLFAADNNADILAVEEFTVNLIQKVQTCVFMRGLPVEVILQMYRSRFGKGCNLLDDGCGIMQVAQQLMMKDEYPFPEVPVYASSASPSPDADLSAKVNRLAGYLPSVLDTCICVDEEKVYHNNGDANVTTPHFDEGRIRWAESSLRPFSERKNAAFMERFRAFAGDKHPNIAFFRADMTDKDDLRKLDRRYVGKKFNVIMYLTSLHQSSPHKQKLALDGAKERLKKGGIIIVQDFAYTRGRSWPNLQYFSHWHDEPYRYRTFVYDSLAKDQSFQEVFRSYPRISRLALGTGKLLIHGKGSGSVAEAITVAAA
jgi:hypothetical protein